MPNDIERSLDELLNHFKWRRLVTEHEGVKGTGWSKWSTTDGHTAINTLRVIIIILFSPMWLILGSATAYAIAEGNKKKWLLDVVHTPPAVLSAPCSGGRPAYDTPHSRPNWMVQINFVNGNATKSQIPWSNRDDSYIAISYPFDSAESIFELQHDVLPAPDGGKPGRKYSWATRVTIAEVVIDNYIRLRQLASGDDRVEYVWFDELCLSDPSLPPGHVDITRQRQSELGRLTDIFTGAASVVIFCHIPDCSHTDLECPWGNRLFTLAEIYYAKSVQIMTRSSLGHMTITHRHGRDFKHDMQRQATLGNGGGNWHLSAVLEHATQSSSASWQLAIHYLIVEAIRRDMVGGFKNHEHLGRSINGLLPRRSLLDQFTGAGWSDLNWMLELNQGYYNATALAAVCSLADHDDVAHSWLGKPIEPKVGNERLEPIVKAFPVPTGLNLMAPQVIQLNSCLVRDGNGLTSNRAMRGLKIASFISFAVLVILGLIIAFTGHLGGLFLLWLACAQCALAYLVAGSMYVERNGWIVLSNLTLAPKELPTVQTASTPPPSLHTNDKYSHWQPANPEDISLPTLLRESDLHAKVDAVMLGNWLKERDHQLGKLHSWGSEQLAPKWESPDYEKVPTRPALVIDLEHQICAKTIVVNTRDDDEPTKLKLPDRLVPLAVHGCGITCMLLDSYKEPLVTDMPELAKAFKDTLFATDIVAKKMGMVNLPPHILTYGTMKGSLRIGENDKYVPPSTPRVSMSDEI